MARTPSPLHDKSAPLRVSKPTITAEAAAAVAESAVAPAPAARRPRASQPRAASFAQKSAPTKKTAVGKAAPAKKAKQASAAEAPSRAGAATPAATHPPKAHKPKLVRDSFTIPKDEYAVLEALKARALALGQHVRKSELLRAGIHALNAMNDGALLAAVGAVPTLKTGRPRKG